MLTFLDRYFAEMCAIIPKFISSQSQLCFTVNYPMLAAPVAAHQTSKRHVGPRPTPLHDPGDKT